jgi:hypothetical protein
MPQAYDSFTYLPKVRLGSINGTNSFAEVAVSSEGAGALSTGTIIGSSVSLAANSSTFVSFTNGFDGNFISGTFVVGAIAATAVEFNLWITNLFAGYLNFSNAQNWGTGTNVNVTAATYSIYGNLSVGASSLTLAQATLVAIPEGRIVVPDYVNAALSDRAQRNVNPYRLIDQATAGGGLIASSGVSMISSIFQTVNITGFQNSNASERFKVLKKGEIWVSAITAINNPNTALLVETAGVNKGRITTTATVSTFALNSANYQVKTLTTVPNALILLGVETL